MKTLPSLAFITLLLAAALTSPCHAGTTDQMAQYTSKARELSSGQPPAAWEYPFDYEDADIVRFVSDDFLLVGAVESDIHHWPVYGPLIMYDVKTRCEKWRVDRVCASEAAHELFATTPLVILRTTFGDKVTYQAIDRKNGKLQWKYDHTTESITANGDYNSEGLKNIYELSGKTLRNISIRDGSVLWKTETPSKDAGSARRLLTTPDFVYVVGSRNVTAFDSRDGKRLWECPQTAGEPFEAVVNLDGIFVYSAGQADAYAMKTGEKRWTWKPGNGVIKFMTETPELVYAVVQYSEKQTDDIVALDRKNAGRIWQTSLDGYAASPLVTNKDMVYATVGHLEEKIGGMVDKPVPLFVYTARRDLAGLSITTGKKRLNVVLPTREKNPLEWFCQPQLDQIAIRDSLILIARDDYGITGVGRIAGTVSWNQPHKSFLSAYAKGVQLVAMYDVTTMKSYQPGGDNSLTAPRPSRQHSMMQANNEAHIEAANRVLNNSGASSTDRSMARLTKEIYTSAEMNRQTIDASFSRAQAGADLAFGIMAFGNIFEQARRYEVEMSKKTAFYNGMLFLRFGTWQHNMSLVGRYCLQAYPGFATVLDLEKGMRCDLNITPVVENGYSDKPMASISPDGKWLAAVGIGLDGDHYTPVKKNGKIVPNSSVVLYAVSGLSFTETIADNKPVTAVFEGKPAVAAAPSIGLMAASGDYQAMQAALAKGGADPNEMFANLTPLTLAASRGDKKMVALLLSNGADVTVKNKIGNSTAYDVLTNVADANVRQEIRDMLDKAKAVATAKLSPKP